MQVVPSVAKFATIASGVMLLLDLIQVTESISGSVVPLAMFFFLHSPQGKGQTIKTRLELSRKFIYFGEGLL